MKSQTQFKNTWMAMVQMLFSTKLKGKFDKSTLKNPGRWNVRKGEEHSRALPIYAFSLFKPKIKK